MKGLPRTGRGFNTDNGAAAHRRMSSFPGTARTAAEVSVSVTLRLAGGVSRFSGCRLLVRCNSPGVSKYGSPGVGG